MPVYMKGIGEPRADDPGRVRRKGLGRRKAGTSRAWKKVIAGGGETVSNADRARDRDRVRRFLNKARTVGEANTISNRDVHRLLENDGGMAMSGRGKPVRTF